MSEEETPGPGLMASIFLVPHIFGWLVFLPGYSLITRFVVVIYMIMTAIPLYFLIVTLWGSGDDVKSLAKDFNRNREVASRNADAAQEYMDDYTSGQMTFKSDRDAKPRNSEEAEIINLSSVQLALAFEKNKEAIKSYQSKIIAINGKATSAAQGNILYLEGADYYPAVTLTYSGTAPNVKAGENVTARCEQIEMAISGPSLKNCV